MKPADAVYDCACSGTYQYPAFSYTFKMILIGYVLQTNVITLIFDF